MPPYISPSIFIAWGKSLEPPKSITVILIETALNTYKEIREKRLIEKQELIKSLKSTTVIMPK